MTEHDCLEALATLVAERIHHRDDDTFLTTAELAERYDCDARTARDIAKRAGAIKLGQGYQVRLDHLRAWEDEEAQRSRDGSRPVSTPSTAVSGQRRRPRLRTPPPEYETLKPGWWREE